MDTFERRLGPLHYVISGATKVPLLPPLPGQTEPFAWAFEPGAVMSMDVDGRPVESATATAHDDRATLVVRFKDGGEETYDLGAVQGDCPADEESTH